MEAKLHYLAVNAVIVHDVNETAFHELTHDVFRLARYVRNIPKLRKV